MLSGDGRVKDKRETRVKAIPLTQESDAGGMDQGGNQSSKKSLTSGCTCKLKTTEFTDNWVV